MRGFTLIETIIYVALFGILMMGMIVSLRPILTGAERMNEKVMIENEVTLVSRTITSLIPQIDPSLGAVSPGTGATANYVSFSTYKSSPAAPTITYWFTVQGGAVQGGVKAGSAPVATSTMTASRVHFDSMSAKRVAPSGGTPGYIELSYVITGAGTTTTYGPIRSYLDF